MTNSLTEDIFIEPRSSRPQSTDFSGPFIGPTFRLPRSDGGASFDGFSPARGNSWANIVNTSLLPMLRKSSTANNNATSHGQTVDLATAKLNDLYSSGNVLRFDGLEKFRRFSKGHSRTTTPPLTIA